jgi:diguanylate cyclase (GGDEF)-like protein
MPTGTTVDFNEAKVIFSSTDQAGLTESDLRWRLLQALQTSLEMEVLLNIFYDQVQSTVAFDGFSYKLDLLDLDVNLGKQSVHSCSYRLITQQDYLGELTFYRSTRFPERDLAVLEGLLNIIVFPLRNAIRYRDAATAALADPLTGAGNRIALSNTLQREIELAKRYDQSMAVLMLDIDHLSCINERYGQSCGDRTLIHLVQTLRSEIRGSDVVFRHGGEEFVVLLTNTNQSTALDVAERIRKQINRNGVEHRGETINVSASIGVSMLHPDDTVTRILERASFAMYNAKSEGRDQVKVCYESAVASN